MPRNIGPRLTCFFASKGHLRLQNIPTVVVLYGVIRVLYVGVGCDQRLLSCLPICITAFEMCIKVSRKSFVTPTAGIALTVTVVVVVEHNNKQNQILRTLQTNNDLNV